MIANIISLILFITSFLLVTLPSILYGLIPNLLIPLAWLVRLLMQRRVFTYKAGVIALKFSTIILLIVIPTILYIFTWQPLGVIFFSWIGLYLLIRLYSGVHEKEKLMIEAAKKLESFEKQHNHYYVKSNPTITIITLILTVTSLLIGYYIGGEKGLYICIGISVIIWCISPYAR